MDYSRYKVSRDLSWQILLNEHITELPVMVGQLCRSMGIWMRYDTPTDGNDGFSIMAGRQPVIFVSSACSKERQRFTAAHELGHILLGHVGKFELVNREPSALDNPIEQEANVFASRLLAPACVLWGCGARTTEDIMHLCQISRPAAEIRAQRMELLYQRGRFLASPTERKVYEQFLPFILANKENDQM